MTTQVAEFAERKILEQGSTIVNRLFSLMKISQIYDKSNRTYLSHIDATLAAINAIVQTDGRACLETVSEALFINGTRLKPDFSSWSSFRFAIDSLDSRGIGKLTFHPGLSPEELSRFSAILGEVDVSSPDPFAATQGLMANSDIHHVTIDRIQETEAGKADRGDGCFAERAKRSFYYSISYLKTVSSQISSGQIANVRKSKRIIQSFVDQIITDESYMLGLTTIKNFDEYTLNHSINVCILSLALGLRLGLDKSQLCDLGVAALFHDLGKIQIPQEIINKPGKLTEEEYDEIKKHTYKGAILLSRIRGLGSMPVRAMLVALQHHQTLDHQGYPQTPNTTHPDLYSSIVAIADFFDAATAPRVYKLSSLKRDQTLQLIIERSGTQVDPLLAKVFVEMLGFIPVGSLVLLDTGQLAIVWKPNPDPSNAQRPKVKIITDEQGNFIDPIIVSLMERTPDDSTFARKILKSLDPFKYGIEVASYL